MQIGEAAGNEASRTQLAQQLEAASDPEEAVLLTLTFITQQFNQASKNVAELDANKLLGQYGKDNLNAAAVNIEFNDNLKDQYHWYCRFKGLQLALKSLGLTINNGALEMLPNVPADETYMLEPQEIKLLPSQKEFLETQSLFTLLKEPISTNLLYDFIPEFHPDKTNPKTRQLVDDLILLNDNIKK